MRPLRLFFLRNYRPGRDPLSRRVPLPPTIRLLFGGGAAQNSCARETHWGSPSPLLGWPRTPPTWDGGGGLCLGRNTYGDWSHYRVLPHIRYWSFRPSFCLSITSYPSFVSALLLPTDNVTVAADINKQGGTRSTRLKSCGHGAGAGILSRSPSTAPGRTSLLRTSCPAAAFPPRSGPSTPRSWPLFSERSVPFTWICFASALYAQLQRYCAQALDSAAWRIEPSRFGGRYSRGTFFPPTHPPNSTEGEAGSGYRPPHCPVVAEENVVPRNDNPSSGVSENPPRSQGRDIPADTGDPAPKAVRPPPDCLALVREAGAQAGFSERAAAVIARSRRDSTREAYIPVLQDFSVGANLRGWIPVRHLWRTWPFSELPFW